MTEDKPKYIRKKCEHGTYSFQCKDCKECCICEHGKRKIYCKECDGSGYCIHDRIKQNIINLSNHPFRLQLNLPVRFFSIF